MRRFHRLISLLVTFCMVTSMLPTAAFATETSVPAETEVQDSAEVLVEESVETENSTTTTSANEDTIAYLVEGGNIYFNVATGTITDCDADVHEAVIPKQINGVNVVAIRERAFGDCQALKYVFIPEGVRTIGTEAFFRCINLEKIVIPDTAINFGDHVFLYTEKLISAGPVGGDYNIEFGWTTKIPSKAFMSSNLHKISIPYGITTIEEFAFYCDQSFINYSNNLSELKSIKLPESVTTVEGYAFSGCVGLTELIIPESVVSIGDHAFEYCKNLEQIVIPSSVITWGEAAFYRCSALKDVTLTEGISTLGASTFFQCYGLTQIRIPESMVTIPAELFYDCMGLTSVVIPKSIVSIDREAFHNCPLSDVYYAGTEDEWGNISVEYGNTTLTDATIHYNSTGPEDENPSESQTGSVRFFEQWDADEQAAYWGGTSLIGGNRSVVVEGTSDLSFLEQIDQLVGTYVQVEDRPGENGVLSDRILLSIKPVNSQFGVVEDIIVGNGNPAVTSLQFSNQTYAVVDGVKVSDSLIGEPLLYHLRAEEIVGYEVLDELTGTLKSWDSATREIVIDGDESGEVTTTVSELASEDTMSVLNGNTIQNPSITYLTDNMGFVYQVSITGNENPDVPEIYFDVDLYRANQFLDPDRYPHAYSLTDDINRGTPSSIYAEAFAGNDGFQSAVTSWNGTTGVLDVLDKGPTEAGKLMIEKKDIYIALILSSLQESTADKNAGTMEDVVGGLHEIFQEIGESVKDELGIDIFITEQYVSMTKEEKELIAKKLKDHPEISPSLAVFDDASELLSNIMTVTKSVEDYCTMLGNNIYLATLATEQKELVEEMYKNCPASNQALKAALLECKTITKLNYDQAIAGTMAIASSGTMVSTCADIFWKASIDALEKVCPMVGAILAGYNAGKTASNILCNTDSITENYYKIVAMTELEKVAVDTLNSLENRYASSRTSENARLYLSMIDTLYGMLSVDCKQAYNMVDTLDDTGLNLLAKVLSDILGNEGSVANSYAAIKQQIEGIERSYKTHHQNILTVWVEYLPEDYPNSNLYDYYNALLSGASYEMVKQLLVACPVNVEIMDSSGNVVASVVDGRISASGNITVQLMGEQKLFTFYDAEAYQVQITGYDSGTMNVTVTEWNDQQEEVRHVYYTNIPVATNQSYIMNMEGEALEQEAYQLTDNEGFEVDQGYDTAHPEDAKTHTIQIENGYLNLDGTVSVSAQAFPGQKIQISALALSDQSLIRWDVTGGVSLDDPTALSTSFIMPDNDVVLYAVLSESELLPEIPDEPEQDHDSNTGSSGSSSTSYSITVKNSLYGSVKSDERRASQGDTVTLTLSPDDGYELKSLIVLDRSNEEIEVEKVSENEYTFEMPRSAVTVEALFALAAEAVEPLPFTDVTEGTWYYDAVCYAYKNELMAGTSTTTFSPNLITTRGMIVTILYRLEDTPIVSGGSDFTDVEIGQWYSDAIAWAAANNIVGGYGNGLFGPDDPITREQLAAILYRYAQYKSYDTTASADLSRYTDLGQLSEWAQEAVAWANSEGIISGTSAVTLAPKDSATRAQAAAMMMRFCENITP